MARTLHRFDQVVEALGGTTAAASLIGRRPPVICQWRQKYGAFPASFYFVVNDLLAARGCKAAVGVFRFEQSQARRE